MLWQIDGEIMETVRDFILGGSKSLQMVTAAMKLKTIAPWKKSYDHDTHLGSGRLELNP